MSREAQPYKVVLVNQIDYAVEFVGTRTEIVRKAKSLAPASGFTRVYDRRDGPSPREPKLLASKPRLLVDADGAVYECRNAARFYRFAE